MVFSAAAADLKVVHDMLGHSSIVLATDTYSPSRGRLQSG
jgi:hypothetical protein